MLKSEIVKTFDERRNAFTPYGFTCELWAPKPMDKLDRHNEIELNYLPEGTLTYFFKESKITVPAGKLLASRLSITQITFDSGFNSVSRFNRAFLKINGCTLREYRKQVSNPSLDF